MDVAQCPCLSGESYQDCCRPFHEKISCAGNAEQLMRSRYSAFCLQKITYLIDTTHSQFRRGNDEQVLRETIQNTTWTGLKVLNSESTENSAIVEFVAFYVDNPIGQLHERSRFSRVDNQWFYYDGDMMPPVKLTRNESCFCGSGQKFKKCHGN